MSFLGGLAVIFCIALIPLALKKLTTQNLMVVLLLLSFHVLASYYYYTYTYHAAADAWGYYFDPTDYNFQSFRVGTIAVYKVVHFLKSRLNATYLDSFLVFQMFGFFGLLILARIFEEIQSHLEVPHPRGYLVLLFLPSINFWSAAIGKDAPLFFATSLTVWSMLRLSQRFLYFCVALGVMVLFRAHIALLATIALAAAAFFERATSTGRKFGLMTFAIVGMGIVLGPAQSTIKMESITSIGAYVANQQSSYATSGGATGVVQASLPFRLFSLLFRPLFVDANGLLGLVASAENVGVIMAFLHILIRWRDLAHLARRVLFVRFVLFFAAILLFSLALVYYNVGLGLRERLMAYPMVLSALVAFWAYRRKALVRLTASEKSTGLAPANTHRPMPQL